MKRFILAIAVAVAAAPAFAQQQPFQEQIDVNAVLLDVVVTDPKGNQILGLTKDDFVVTENGVAQTIDSVDYFTNRILLDSRESQAPVNVERIREDRYFVFFFDRPTDPGVFFDELATARDAVKKFMSDDMKQDDLIAIAGHDVRLKIYSDFTRDRAQIERALNEAAKFGPGLKSAPAGDGPSILRSIDTKAMVNHTGTVYQALDLLADSLRPIRARKNLVIFSPGILERGESVRGEMILSRSRYLDPMLESLNAANVTAYGVQLQRNVTTAPLFHQRLGEIADSTGGRYFQLNTNYTNALDEIEQTSNGYYLLTYRSRHPKGTSGFQKVEVSVRNREMRVVARSGYHFGR